MEDLRATALQNHERQHLQELQHRRCEQEALENELLEQLQHQQQVDELHRRLDRRWRRKRQQRKNSDAAHRRGNGAAHASRIKEASAAPQQRLIMARGIVSDPGAIDDDRPDSADDGDGSESSVATSTSSALASFSSRQSQGSTASDPDGIASVLHEERARLRAMRRERRKTEAEVREAGSEQAAELLRRKRSNANAAAAALENLRRIVASFEEADRAMSGVGGGAAVVQQQDVQQQERDSHDPNEEVSESPGVAAEPESREDILAAIEDRLQSLEGVERLLDLIVSKEHKADEIERLAEEREQQVEALRISMGTLERWKDREMLLLECDVRSRLGASRADDRFRDAYRALDAGLLGRCDVGTSTVTPLPDYDGIAAAASPSVYRWNAAGTRGPLSSRGTPSAMHQATRLDEDESFAVAARHPQPPASITPSLFASDQRGRRASVASARLQRPVDSDASDGSTARQRSARGSTHGKAADADQELPPTSIASRLAVNKLAYPDVPAPLGPIVFLVCCAVKAEEHADAWERELSGMLAASVRLTHVLVRLASSTSGYIYAAERFSIKVAFASSADAVNFAVRVQDEASELDWGAPLLRFKSTATVRDPRGESKVVLRGPRVATSVHLIDTKLRARAELNLLSKRTTYVGPDAEVAHELLQQCARGGEIVMLASTWELIRHRLPPLALGCVASEVQHLVLEEERSRLALGRLCTELAEGLVVQGGTHDGMGGSALSLVRIFTFDNKHRLHHLGPSPRQLIQREELRASSRNGSSSERGKQKWNITEVLDSVTRGDGEAPSLPSHNHSESASGSPLVVPGAQRNAGSASGGLFHPGPNLKPFRHSIDKSKATFVVVTVPHLAAMLAAPWGMGCWAQTTATLRECFDSISRANAPPGRQPRQRKPSGGGAEVDEKHERDGGSGDGEESCFTPAPGGATLPPDKMQAMMLSASFDEVVFIFRAEHVALRFCFVVHERLASTAWPVDLSSFYVEACKQTTPPGLLWGPGVRVSIGVAASVPLMSAHRSTGLYQYDGLALSIARELCCFGRPGETLIPNSLCEHIVERGMTVDFRTHCLNPYKTHNDQRIFAIYPATLEGRFNELGPLKGNLLTKLITNIHEIRMSEGEKMSPYAVNRRMSSFTLARSKVTDAFLIVARNMCTSHVQFDAMMRYVHAGAINERSADVFLRLMQQGVKSGLLREAALADLPAGASDNVAAAADTTGAPASRAASRSSFSRSGASGGNGFVAFDDGGGGSNPFPAPSGGGGGAAGVSRRRSVTLTTPLLQGASTGDGAIPAQWHSRSNSLVDNPMTPSTAATPERCGSSSTGSTNDTLVPALGVRPTEGRETRCDDDAATKRREEVKAGTGEEEVMEEGEQQQSGTCTAPAAAEPSRGRKRRQRKGRRHPQVALPYIPHAPRGKINADTATTDAVAGQAPSQAPPLFPPIKRAAHQTMGLPPPPPVARQPQVVEQQQQMQRFAHAAARNPRHPHQMQSSAPPPPPLGGNELARAAPEALKPALTVAGSSGESRAERKGEVAALVRGLLSEQRARRSVRRQLARERRREEARHKQVVDDLINGSGSGGGGDSDVLPVDGPRAGGSATNNDGVTSLHHPRSSSPSPPPSSTTSSSSSSSANEASDDGLMAQELTDLLLEYQPATGARGPLVSPPSHKIASGATGRKSCSTVPTTAAANRRRVRSVGVQCALGPRMVVKRVLEPRPGPVPLRETRYGSMHAAAGSSLAAARGGGGRRQPSNLRGPPSSPPSRKPTVVDDADSAATPDTARAQCVDAESSPVILGSWPTSPPKPRLPRAAAAGDDGGGGNVNDDQNPAAAAAAAAAAVEGGGASSAPLCAEDARIEDSEEIGAGGLGVAGWESFPSSSAETGAPAESEAQVRDAMLQLRVVALVLRDTLVFKLARSAVQQRREALHTTTAATETNSNDDDDEADGGAASVVVDVIGAQIGIVQPLARLLRIAGGEGSSPLDLTSQYLDRERLLCTRHAAIMWKIGFTRWRIHAARRRALDEQHEQRRRARWSLVGALERALSVERGLRRGVREQRARALLVLIDRAFNLAPSDDGEQQCAGALPIHDGDAAELVSSHFEQLTQNEEAVAVEGQGRLLGRRGNQKKKARAVQGSSGGGAPEATMMAMQSRNTAISLSGDESEAAAAHAGHARGVGKMATSIPARVQQQQQQQQREEGLSTAEVQSLRYLAQALQHLDSSGGARGVVSGGGGGKDQRNPLFAAASPSMSPSPPPPPSSPPPAALLSGAAALESPRARRQREVQEREAAERERGAREHQMHAFVAARLDEVHQQQLWAEMDAERLQPPPRAQRLQERSAPTVQSLLASPSPPRDDHPSARSCSDSSAWLCALNRRIKEHQACIIAPLAGHASPPRPKPKASETDPRNHTAAPAASGPGRRAPETSRTAK